MFRCVVRPALQFESLIETMFALAADGKTNRKGMPNPLRLAVIVGSERALRMAIDNTKTAERFGALGRRLKNAMTNEG